MAKQLFKYKWYMAVILLLIIVEPSINSVLNFWLQRLFNSASPGADRLPILRLLTIGFLLWMLKRLVVYSTGVIRTRFICSAKQDVKHRMFLTLMGLNTANLSGVASSGEYISLFTNDITILETRFYTQVIGLIGNLFALFILGTSFFVLSSRLAGAIITFGVVSLLVPIGFSAALNQKNLAYSRTISRFTQRMKEYMVAYPTIKNYSIEGSIVQRFDAINQETEDAKFEADCVLTLADNVGQMLSWFMQFIAVGLGLMMVTKGEIVVATVIAAQAFASDLAAPLQNIIININSIRSVREIVRRLEELSHPRQAPEQLSPRPEAEGGFSAPEGCDIVFDDLSLQLGDKVVIDHFSYTFRQGKKYLVVGLNGAGKSSVFRALKKWYSGYRGRILVGGTDVSRLQSQQLSRVVSYINENVSLFSGSVRDNISLFRQQNPEAFSQAVQAAQVRLDLDREISEDGRNISSGEQRRIEIARSLLGEVKVLIFDEVVSTLDIETAYEIEKLALDFKDKTVIFVSHNFSGKLIRAYDEILIVDNGRLLAHGGYDELMESCPYFKKICGIKFG